MKCRHIYEVVGQEICPDCGGYTHETNWDLIAKQRKAHREKYGILYVVREWWSI